ncbi:GDP-L-fucose synthase [Algiphilus sp.]|uniref:GDP-L-fucose synthase n=1 Tax=Algiphilus sp. TaxID=1872431 RepID=UPI003BAC8461
MLKDSRVFVAGHRGLVGSAICRKLEVNGYSDVLTQSRSETDLTDPGEVRQFFAELQPEYVFLAAAKVGGIHANNSAPADFLRDNLQIQLNVIDAAYQAGVKKLVFLGSSCIYPKHAPQPMKEEHLLTGPLEPTNEWYAIAKIAGIKQCQAYRRQYGFNAISLMPTNLYGPGDNFDLQNSHVLPALIRKFHEAREAGDATVTVWGSGTPRREFLHVDDLADACLYLMQNYESEDIVNIGWGEDLRIAELAAMVKDVVGFEGEIVYDSAKPDGTPRKLMDTSRLTGVGWRPSIGLREGLEQTYRWYLENREAIRT